jgi:DNA-directed RNA polymerase subunit RPC12/RpoP
VILALVIGTMLAVGALAFVLYPLFFTPPRPLRVERVVAPRLSPRDEAVAALREIEFDRETGKLSDTDYAELKTRYTKQAIEAMRRESRGGGTVSKQDDEIEVAVRAYREQHAACPTCGPRPEPDAVYCSTCGRYLRDRCADCGAPVDALDARYCVNCGHRLAA